MTKKLDERRSFTTKAKLPTSVTCFEIDWLSFNL